MLYQIHVRIKNQYVTRLDLYSLHTIQRLGKSTKRMSGLQDVRWEEEEVSVFILCLSLCSRNQRRTKLYSLSSTLYSPKRTRSEGCWRKPSFKHSWQGDLKNLAGTKKANSLYKREWQKTRSSRVEINDAQWDCLAPDKISMQAIKREWDNAGELWNRGE